MRLESVPSYVQAMTARFVFGTSQTSAVSMSSPHTAARATRPSMHYVSTHRFPSLPGLTCSSYMNILWYCRGLVLWLLLLFSSSTVLAPMRSSVYIPNIAFPRFAQQKLARFRVTLNLKEYVNLNSKWFNNYLHLYIFSQSYYSKTVQKITNIRRSVVVLKQTLDSQTTIQDRVLTKC